MAGAVEPIDVAATLTALGTVAALFIGARATRGKTETTTAAVEPVPLVADPASTPAAIRERLAALEARVEAQGDQLAEHAEQIALLRALEVAYESSQRPAPARRRRAAP